MNQLLKAITFAAEKHANQRRKNAAAAPYINHPLEVMEHLSNVGGVSDEPALMAAVLHDTVEDTDTTPEELEALFDVDVRDLVMECTDDKRLPKEERKRLQIVQAPHKSDRAKMIKISDTTCNLRGMTDDPPADWPLSRLVAYFEWAKQVFEGLRGVNAELDRRFEEVSESGLAELRKRRG